MDEQTKPRPNGHIWMSAEQFYNAAELIMANESVDLNRYVLPLLVNYALCVELSLKAAEGTGMCKPVSQAGLISASATKSAVRGHELDKVFAALQSDTQRKIANEFSVATGEPLMPLLEICSNYFIQARYSYEQIGAAYDLTAVRTLARGLLQAVRVFDQKSP